MKIMIDAGHGGKDSGAINGRHQESVYAFDIAQRLGALLSSYGVTIGYTRTDDTYIGIRARAKKANEWNADAFISIHLNSADNVNAHGIETLIYSTESAADKLAHTIQSKMIHATGAVNRGIKTRTNLGVLHLTSMPAILIETGFISNSAECAKLALERYRQTIAQAVADGIVQYYKIYAYTPVNQTKSLNVKEEADVPTIYQTKEDIPSWAKETVEKLMANGALKGDENGNLNLEYHMLRTLVINDRMGLYEK